MTDLLSQMYGREFENKISHNVLQERMALFAVNFIHWTAHWLSEQSQDNTLDIRKLGVKRQVQVVFALRGATLPNGGYPLENHSS